jgi:hypothetical protein
MTAAPIHWPGDGDAVDGKHVHAAVAGNAFGRDLGNREPLIRGVSQRRGFEPEELAVKRLVSLGNTRQAMAGWRATAASAGIRAGSYASKCSNGAFFPSMQQFGSCEQVHEKVPQKWGKMVRFD